MGELFAAGHLEGVHHATQRIDAAHHMLDDAVFAGGIHALEHDQHRPSAMGVQTLLHVSEPRDAIGKDRAHFLDVGRKAETFRRIEIGKLELVRLVDPAPFDDLGEFHRQSGHSLMPRSLVRSPTSPNSFMRAYSCQGLTKSPTIPATPLVWAGGCPGGTTFAVTSSFVNPGGSSVGARSVAIRTKV